jgi:hypothetical protein
MTPSVLRLYSVDGRMIDEYGAIGRMKIGREAELFGETPLQ